MLRTETLCPWGYWGLRDLLPHSSQAWLPPIHTLTEGGFHEGEAGEEPEEGHVAPCGNVQCLGEGSLLCPLGLLTPLALPSQRSQRVTALFSGDLGDKWGPSPSGSQAGSQPGTHQPLGKGQLPCPTSPIRLGNIRHPHGTAGKASIPPGIKEFTQRSPTGCRWEASSPINAGCRSSAECSMHPSSEIKS